FSEQVEPSFSKIVVYDTGQQEVDRGDSRVAPDDPESMIVTLKPNLPNGTYAIAWVTQSKVDGHIVRGIVPFGIGVASAPVGATASEGVAAGAVSGSPLEMALRWLTLLSICALAGAFAFWLLQDGLLVGASGAVATTVRPAQVRLAVALWILFLISNLALLLNQASLAVGTSLLGAIGAPAVQVAVLTHYGNLWIARMVLGVALGAIVLLRPRLAAAGAGGARATDRSALVVGGLLLLSVSLSSHSAAFGSLSPLGVANDWLHLAAVAVWVGGLLQLAAFVPAVLRTGGSAERTLPLTLVVPRFAVVAGISLAALGATGLIEALFHVGTLDNLIDTGYGQALLVKILIILPLVAIAAINHFVIRPGFLVGRRKPTAVSRARARDAAGLLKWTVRIEALLAVAVIAAAGVMTSLSPAQQFGTASAGPLTLSAPAGDLQTTLTVTPGRPGPNQSVVDVRDASGQVAANVQQVSLRFTYLDSDLGVTQTVLSPSGAGRFTGQTSDLAVAGRWQTEVTVRRPGKDDATAEFGFAVTASGAESLQGAPLQLGWNFYVGLLIVVVGALAIARGAWLRQRIDVRRAAAVAVCGLCLGGIGGALAFRDVQQAQAQVAASAASLAHPPTAQSIADGAVVFRANCAVCHGVDAQGDGPMAQSLSPPPSNLIVHVPLHPDGDLENWIATGFPGSAMPAFQDKLTDQQRWDVLNYLKAQVDAANQAAPPGSQGSGGGAAAIAGSAPATTSGAVPPSPGPVSTTSTVPAAAAPSSVATAALPPGPTPP
ncbi:MAG: CopD family protein, partial [Chloroflexota bacterium]